MKEKDSFLARAAFLVFSLSLCLIPTTSFRATILAGIDASSNGDTVLVVDEI